MKFLKEIGRDPRVDWLLILFVSGVVAAALAIGGYYLYNAVTGGRFGGKPAATSSTPKLNQNVISSVISKFEAKEEASKKARAGYTGVTDPSI